MQKKIEFQNNNIVYTLYKSKRCHKLRLAVHRNGLIVVTIPFYIKEDVAEKFIKEKEDWILSKINYFKNIEESSERKFIYTDYSKYKQQALILVKERIDCLNKIYGYGFNTINIKNQKTRWGSCSKKGNLNFNYKILFLPERLRDYIIVHELCHLNQLNHSKDYWNLVAKTFPDYKGIRKELYCFSLI